MYVVIVGSTMAEADQPAFLDLVTENAARSLADEPGCRRFDVCVSPDRPGEVLLYEIYDDAAAFETHKSMPHYHGFLAAAGHRVTVVDVVTPAKKDQVAGVRYAQAADSEARRALFAAMKADGNLPLTCGKANSA